MPGLDLVRNEQRAVPGAQLAHAREIVVRRHHRAGLALHRLHHEPGDLDPHGLGRGELLRQRIGIAVGHEAHVLQPLLERLPERCLAHERERAQRLAVEARQRGDERVRLGVEPRELDRALDGVGPVVDEERVLERARRHLGQHARERAAPGLEQLLAVERHARHLLRDGPDDLRVIDAGGEDPVAAQAVDVLATEDVLQDRARRRTTRWPRTGRPR